VCVDTVGSTVSSFEVAQTTDERPNNVIYMPAVTFVEFSFDPIQRLIFAVALKPWSEGAPDLSRG
jgi:hypothetical protein